MSEVKRKAKSGPFDKAIGRRVKIWRDMEGVSQETLGELWNVSYQQIQKYEAGANRIAAGKLVELANITGRSVEWFCQDVQHDGRIKDPGAYITRKDIRFLEDFQNTLPRHKQAVSMLVGDLAEHFRHRSANDS